MKFKNLFITTSVSCLMISTLNAQKGTTTLNEKVNYKVERDDPHDVGKLYVALDPLNMDVSMKMFSLNFNVGAYARYDLTNRIAAEARIKKSYFNFEDDINGLFDIEFGGIIKLRDKEVTEPTKIVISSSQSGSTVTTNFIMVPLKRRKIVDFRAGLAMKSVGAELPSSGDNYSGSRSAVNYFSTSIYGGLVIRWINGSIVDLTDDRAGERLVDSYFMASIDGMLTPVNTFRDPLSGELIGDELKNDGLSSLPFGARMNIIYFPAMTRQDSGKKFGLFYTGSVGYRPFLGAHIEVGGGLTILRKK